MRKGSMRSCSREWWKARYAVGRQGRVGELLREVGNSVAGIRRLVGSSNGVMTWASGWSAFAFWVWGERRE